MDNQDEKNKDPGFLNSETSADSPREEPKGKPKSLAEILSKKKVEDTEIFDGDEMVISNSSKSDEELLKYSYHEKTEDEFVETSPSIMDLLKTNAPPVDPLISTDTDIEVGDNINSRIDGKTLDEVLKTSIKNEDDWHKSKHKSIGEATTDKGKHTRLKITLIFAIVLIAAGAFVVNFVIKKPEISDFDSRALPVSFSKIKISPNLKNKKKLEFYYNMAANLYKKQKYKDAVRLFSKLLKTNWNNGLIYGMLGNCKMQLKDDDAAKNYYQLSLKEGYKDNVECMLNFARILKKEKKFTAIISTLVPFEKKYASNQEIQILLAEAYSMTGDSEKILACYRKLNPGNMSEAQLKDYAIGLEKSGDQKSAFKIYLMLGKLYGRTSAYIKAEQLAPDEKTRISILAQIVSKMGTTPKGNYYKLLLALKMIDAKNEREGVALLKSVKTGKLTQKAATQYLMMAPYFDKEPILTREVIEILNKYYAADIKMHNKIMKLIKDSGKKEFCCEFFKQEYSLYPKNAIANYLYALSVNDLAKRKTLLINAIKLSPNLFYARLELAKTYMTEQNWKEARKLLLQCIKQNKYNRDAHYYMTVTRINMSPTSRPLKEYETFLQTVEMPKPLLLKKMVLIAENMAHQKYALQYLEQAEKEPSLKEFCSIEKIKIKLMYKTIKKDDFTNTENPTIKKYYIIYLLGAGEARTVMRMPAEDDTGIEFWKLLIRWKQSLPSWKQKAYKLLNTKKDDPLISTILKIWLKKISLKEAETMFSAIPLIDRPLLACIIAEQYKKNKNRLKSNFFYRKALRYPNPNIYLQFSNYMRKN